jgi:hypothetical protein
MQITAGGTVTTTAAAAACYTGTYPGRPDQVRKVRAAVAGHLAGCPAADDAVLIVSEIVSNAIVHSGSAGEFFTVRVEVYPDYVWIECEGLGGTWHCRPEDDRPHGLDVIQALAGPDNWGTETTGDGGRIVWVRLELPPEGTRPGAAVQGSPQGMTPAGQPGR